MYSFGEDFGYDTDISRLITDFVLGADKKGVVKTPELRFIPLYENVGWLCAEATGGWLPAPLALGTGKLPFEVSV